MKQRSTTPVSMSFTARASAVAAIVLVASAGIMQFGSAVFARDYDAEINTNNQQMQRYQQEAERLGAVAATLQDAVNQLNGQISAIQSSIDVSQKKHDDLVAEMARNETLIQRNRKALGNILAEMHIDDQVSPLEMLASSKSIGDFIDKQEQRATLRTSLNDKNKEIKRLQKKLEENKKDVENILQTQQAQREQLASKQAEQQKLLSDTKNDENTYQQLVGEKRSRIEQIRAEQAEANRRALQSSGGGSVNVPQGIPGGGGYPGEWANAPLDAYVDPWGLYTRECVSYVAWKIWSTGRYVPHFAGAGNANQWPSTAARHGISSGSTPKVGSAAVMDIGYYGHVMYVEAVNGDGTITVSDYNFDWDGLYRYYTRSASGLTYVYF
jgi:surface antigen